jgi:ribonuclease T1
MTSTRTTSSITWLVAIAILAGAALYLFADQLPTGGTDQQPTAVAVDRVQYSSLDSVPIDALPPEALTTLGRISAGGPFPFSRDDTIFQNREGLLPDQPRGYYREYTVITPGEDDRGARRIVAGGAGDLYYTADHYRSFLEIVADES